MADQLVIAKTLINQIEEERVIYSESGVPLAIAIVDTLARDFTLGWAIWRTFTVVDLLESWLNHLLPGYNTKANSMILEFYVREKFYTHTLPAPVSSRDIYVQVSSRITSPADEMNFLLLNAEDNVLEISIDRGIPVQCACTLREVRLEPLVRFFRPYHAYARVREEADLARQIFSKPSQLIGGEDFLYPIPVLS
jgi:hypothetical protein